jgi:hypothetical protein
MAEYARRKIRFNPSTYLRSDEEYEPYYAAFGNFPHMHELDIYLSSKNRADLNDLVAAARRQEENEEMCIDLRALTIVRL